MLEPKLARWLLHQQNLPIDTLFHNNPFRRFLPVQRRRDPRCTALCSGLFHSVDPI